MTAYYNEHDPQAAAWLRELIKAGLIAPGDVDERSIEDVVPNELTGYTQCHFFAGIGVWSYALRCAGWPDDCPVWTGSCPCQPFSQAGKRGGTSDERHLWPAFYHLISQRGPDVVFGEQVASPDGLDWLDVVHADLEAAGYAVGALDLCAAGLGAPHIRQRLFFVADAARGRRDGTGRTRDRGRGLADNGNARGVAHAASERRGEARTSGGRSEERAGDAGEYGDVGNAHVAGQQGRQLSGIHRIGSGGSERAVGQTGATNGFWRDAEWIYCRDGKYRAVEPGTFPLAHGAPARVGRLRGYGNAICAPVAEAFIMAYLETI